MKMHNKFLTTVFFLSGMIFLLTGCGKLEKAEAELQTLQVQYKEAQERLSVLQSDLENANSEITSLQQTNMELESRLDELYTKLGEIHLSPLGSDMPDELFEKKWMFGKDVNVWKTPAGVEDLPDQLIGRKNMNYYMVQPIWAVSDATGPVGGKIWVLVEFMEMDTGLDTVGWVSIDDLVEYTEDTKHLLRYPVSLTDNAINVETGKPPEKYFMNNVYITSYDGDYVNINTEGGRGIKVHKDHVIYPEP